MKNNYRKICFRSILTGIIIINCIFSMSFPAKAEPLSSSPDDTRTLRETYQSTDRDEKRNFPEERIFDEWTGELQEVTYEVLKEEPVTETRLYTETRELPWSREIPTPEATLLKDGIKYELIDTSVSAESVTGRTGWVTGEVRYLGCMEEPDAAKSIRTTYYDEETDETLEVTIPLVEVALSEHSWRDDVTFSLDLEDTAAAFYKLGDQKLKSGELPGIELYPDILNLLDLDRDSYRINEIRWSENGHMRGNASRYASDYTATYAGEIKLPDIPGYAGTAIYRTEQEEETGEVIYTIQASAVYKKTVEPSVLPAVAAGGAVTGCVVFVVLLRYRKKKNNDRRGG